MIEFLKNLDITIFYLINNYTKNIIFDYVMPVVTNVKNFYLIFLILWLLMVFSKNRDYRIAGWTILIALIFSDILSSKILKNIFLRPRPFEVLDNVFKLVSSAGPSFPSSHALNSFNVAALIMLFLRKKVYTITAFVLAFLSAYSRVYVGVHYPSDVIFGAVLGIFIGFLFYKFVDKIFKLSTDKRN
ncbi:MAG: phosphatase PAP2 family protein [Endomicrobiia bacterium]